MGREGLTIRLIVRRLTNILPQSSLFRSDNEFRERVVRAGRAGESDEGDEEGLHVVDCRCTGRNPTEHTEGQESFIYTPHPHSLAQTLSHAPSTFI